MVRFPGGYRVLAALGWRLSTPRWRLRRALLCRHVASGLDAASRRDYELMLVRYAPDVEFAFDPEFEALGLGGTFHGRDGMLELIHAFDEAWERLEFRPGLILDFGDRLILLGGLHLFGATSGVALEREFAQLVELRRGLTVREREFLSWDKGLRAAGLDPDAIALPSLAADGLR